METSGRNLILKSEVVSLTRITISFNYFVQTAENLCEERRFSTKHQIAMMYEDYYEKKSSSIMSCKGL